MKNLVDYFVNEEKKLNDDDSLYILVSPRSGFDSFYKVTAKYIIGIEHAKREIRKLNKKFSWKLLIPIDQCKLETWKNGNDSVKVYVPYKIYSGNNKETEIKPSKGEKLPDNYGVDIVADGYPGWKPIFCPSEYCQLNQNSIE